MAYLNGEEIGRHGSLTPGGIGTIPWNSFVKPLPRALLRTGENVLAVDCAIRGAHEQFSLIPVRVGDVVYDAIRDESVFQAFQHIASGDNVQEVRRYLEGRIAQRASRPFPGCGPARLPEIDCARPSPVTGCRQRRSNR